MNLHRRYSISIDGSQPTGVQDAAGEMLDGTRSGTSGTDYHGEIIAKDLVIGGSGFAGVAGSWAGNALGETSSRRVSCVFQTVKRRGEGAGADFLGAPTFAHASGPAENAMCEQSHVSSAAVIHHTTTSGNHPSATNNQVKLITTHRKERYVKHYVHSPRNAVGMRRI